MLDLLNEIKSATIITQKEDLCKATTTHSQADQHVQYTECLISSHYLQVHKELIIDDISAILKSLLDKLKEPSLHCRSSTNGDDASFLHLHECSRRYHLAESAN